MTTAERIMSNIKIDNILGCWNWIGTKASHGYGLLRYNDKTQRAHRVSYKTFVGPIENNLYVLHKCDNKLCINPSHLFLGSQQDNIDDMHKKGRSYFQKKGEKKLAT